jgi:hypothetical protein
MTVVSAGFSSRKRMKIAVRVWENAAGASGEIDRTSGVGETGELDDPGRAYLSE